MIKKINHMVRERRNPVKVVAGKLLRLCSGMIASDLLFSRMAYFIEMGRPLRLAPPVTYNEKLQWLKLNYRRDDYTVLVDKAAVKPIVGAIIGKEHIVRTYGVWDSFDDIDFDALPDSFVLKTTHDSGGVVVVPDKAGFDRDAARRKLTRSLRRNYYLEHREYPYRDVKPRIMAEEYLEPSDGSEVRDYKFFCFGSEVRMLYVASDRQRGDVKFDFFDADFNLLPFGNVHHPRSVVPPEKPATFELMKSIACKLAQGHPHVRVDLYESGGKVYFGELTFFHMAGCEPFRPSEWDERIGQWLTLPRV